VVVDVGSIGPDYIPGHAHSDTFSFVLYLDGKPLIVDTGTSTYETCERRLIERRTASHNTVQVDGLEQSEVWGSFRVARRAYVQGIVESESTVAASHTGYERIGVCHRREFSFYDWGIVITDTVESQRSHECNACFHFHPDVAVTLEEGALLADGSRITFSGALTVKLNGYDYAPHFNRNVPAAMAVVTFDKTLRTTILHNS
jgi:uncharacterized heparinase superfamily protein